MSELGEARRDGKAGAILWADETRSEAAVGDWFGTRREAGWPRGLR